MMKSRSKFLPLGALMLLVSAPFVGTAQGTTLTLDFSGTTSFNPGLLGPGAFTGSITYDTTGATSAGGNTFANVFSDINFSIGTGSVASQATPTTNGLTQVQLVTGEDALLSTFAGSFGATGVTGVAVESVGLELRTINGGDFFGSTSSLFSSLIDGQVLTLGTEIGFVSLVVRYVGGAGLDTTILLAGNFGNLTATVESDTQISTVPLPAALPLFAGGLGLLGLLGWRRKRTVAAA